MQPAQAPHDPPATTGAARVVSPTAVSVNGAVHPHGLYTTCHFEYGPTESYGWQTEPCALPPRRAAYYRETWDEGFGGWGSFFECEKSHETEGGPSRGYVRLTEQSLIQDFNHEAAGVLHLMTEQVIGPTSEPSLLLGGGDADLRGATVSLWLRGHDWQPNGSEFIVWLQSQSNIELLNNPGWRRANYGYTGVQLTDQLLDGAWHEARFELSVALSASGDHAGAIEELLELFRRDREWNDGAAREQMMTIFDTLGPKDPVGLRGRRRLSSMIFA